MIYSWLLYKDHEMNAQDSYVFAKDIVKDFNMPIIFKTMSRENPEIYMAAQRVMLTPLHTKEELIYRQEIIKDVLKNSDVFFQLYDISGMIQAGLTKESGKKEYKRGRLFDDLRDMNVMTDAMIQISHILRDTKPRFSSQGMKAMIGRILEFDFVKIKDNLRQMDFVTPCGNLTVSMNLGKGLKANHITINECRKGTQGTSQTIEKITKAFHKMTKASVIYVEDEVMSSDVQMLQEAAMQHILNHYEALRIGLRKFFHTLFFEVCFYLGCYHLHTRFEELGIPFGFPTVYDGEGKKLHFEQLYELTLAIYSQKQPVPNNLARVSKNIYIITGANQGGKSTFLRSIGIAQVMMQCGMFVPAQSYSNRLYDTILTHFTRREDEQMNRGRLEEEIHRMSKMVDVVTDRSMILLNESFASTTEKEGSRIAEDLIMALYEEGTDVFMVTHLFEFAKTIYEKKLENAVFLAAERKEDGERTYKMIEKSPNYTSYGLDLYDDIIGG